MGYILGNTSYNIDPHISKITNQNLCQVQFAPFIAMTLHMMFKLTMCMCMLTFLCLNT